MTKYFSRDLLLATKANSDAQYARHEQHRRPNGELGTILKCPAPGCKEAGVEGWGSCGAHFDLVQASYRCDDPLPEMEIPTERLVSELKRRGII